jgi:hypothetical protein
MFERLAVRTGGTVRSLALVLVSGGAVLALAGCNAAASQNTAAGGSAATSAAGASATPAGGSAPAGGAPAVAAGQNGGGECTLADLAISLGTTLPAGAPGVVQRPLVFKNTGSAACFVVGWPGLAALGGGGAQIYQAQRVGTKGPQVMLQPGASASALLNVIAYHAQAGSTPPPCPSVPQLLVTPPDETHSTRIAFGSTVCEQPTLSSLAAGTNGGDATQAQTQFSEARQLWVAGASAVSADQGSYWTHAASLLTNAVDSGAPGTAGFAEAAQELTELAALPDAMLSPAQKTQEVNLVGALNIFFSSPGLYS